VFSSKSIAQELPLESKKFKGIDKQWLKIMEKAADTKVVVQCCINDILKNSLPSLQEGLEVCQKKLENFLETKRSLFPRFYFISNADLLKILSAGSDPNNVQDDYEKLFDAVHEVDVDEQNRKLITRIVCKFGGCMEKVTLTEPVLAEGNIEDWLGKLEKEMQRSMRQIAANGAKEVFSMQNNLRDFYEKFQSQVALLGLQAIWADFVTECLQKSNKERPAELTKKLKKNQAIKDELVDFCLEDLDKLKRCKIETLVTIHVHQVDVFKIISEDARANRIKDENDFDWCKNTRVAYRREDNHINVAITDVNFTYSYEFLGAKERLCITALTDRCYVTLS
jgi:dynein heavy chain